MLSSEIVLHIVSFLDDPFCSKILNELFYFAPLGQPIKDEYYKYCLMTNSKMEINCFHEKITPELEKFKSSSVFQFASREPGLVIAGGFPTQLWLNRKPLISSDIDIFVFTSEALKNLLHFFALKKVKTVFSTNRKTGVFQLQMQECHYTIQVIYIQAKGPYDVIEKFDFSYCRCLIFKGNLYATPDAVRSLQTRKTIIYKKVRACRISKALRYVDEIINVSSISLKCNCAKPHLFEFQLSELEIVTTQFKGYNSYVHTYIKPNILMRDYDIQNRRLQTVPYLYFCSPQFLTQAIFRLNYYVPSTTDMLLLDKYFYTNDPRYEDVHHFWIGLENLIQKIAYNRSQISGRMQKGQRTYNYQSKLLKRILKPLNTRYDSFTYFKVESSVKFKGGREYKFGIRMHKFGINIVHLD